MKHKLLSVIALLGAAFTSTSVSAQWTAPVKPAAPETQYQGEWATPEAGGQYYLYNVGAGMFLGGGQTWGTRGIVLMDSVVTVSQDPVQINNTQNNTTANYVLPFQLEADETIENGFYINHLNTSKANSSAGSFVGEDGSQTWIDGDATRRGNYGQWTITSNENGTYRIANVYAHDVRYTEHEVAFGVDGNNLGTGWATTWTDLAVEPQEESTIIPWLEWRFVSVDQSDAITAYIKDYQANKLPAYQAAMNVHNARVALYNAYTKAVADAETAEVNIDDAIAEAEAIYNNSAATVEDLNSATTTLNAAVNAAIFASQFNGTPNDPQEVTGLCLVNPNFDTGNIDGWTNTFSGKATNIGYQSNASYTNNGTTLTSAGSTTDDDGNPAFLNKFIEAWRNNADPWKIGDAELSQTVYGLPAGMYKLSCDINAHQQYSGHEGLENPVKGVKLFIAPDNGEEVFQEVATGNGNPEHFSITFICTEGVKALTFGLKTENTTANWIAADNFRIYYLGVSEDSPALASLKLFVKEAEATEYDESTPANKEVKATYFEALENAQTLSAGGHEDEEYKAAEAALRTALTAMTASKDAYITLAQNASDVSWDEFAASISDDCLEAVGELLDEWSAAYEEETADNEYIAATNGALLDLIKSYITPENVKEGTDLSKLIVNPGFDNGITGWKVASGATPAVNYSEAEVYMAKFNFSQTIKNMPKGAYTIGVNAFTRVQPGGERAAFRKGDDTPSRFYLYGGASEVPVMRIQDDGHETPLKGALNSDGTINMDYDYTQDANGYDFSYEYEDEFGNTNVRYVPNDMDGAQRMFQAGHYYREVTVVLTEDGDLTFGLKTESAEDWNLWDNFTLKYAGNKADLYEETINNLVEELARATEADDAFLTQKATQLAEEMPAKAQKAIDDADADACVAVIAELQEAVNSVKKGNELGKELASSVEFYYDQIGKLETLVPTMEEYDQLLETWIDPYSMAEELADNDALQALIDKIDADWIPYLMSGAVDASKDAPIEVTAVIYNPTYVDPKTAANSANGWTSVNAEGTAINPGLNYSEAEFFNTNYNHYQTIKGLLPGYYTVTVDAYYRAGGYARAALAYVADTLEYNATMYAIGVDSMSVAVKDIFVGAQETAIAASDEVTVELGQDITRYIPNMPVSGQTYLETGLYVNTLNVEVGEDGVLTIGLSKYSLITDDWTNFNNWTLTYLGAGPENAPDAVQRIDAANTGIQSIYNLAGQKVQKAQKGIYIINGKKVVVK